MDNKVKKYLWIVIFAGLVNATGDFYALIKFSSKWSEYCPIATTFKSSLASFVSIKLQKMILSKEVRIQVKDGICNNVQLQNQSVEMRVTLLDETSQPTTTDLSRTKLLIEALKGSPYIGGLKISSVVLHKEEKEPVFTTKNIIILLSAICLLYFIGYATILGTLSDNDKQERNIRKKVFELSSDEGFRSSGARDSNFTQTEFSKKAMQLKRELSNVQQTG